MIKNLHVRKICVFEQAKCLSCRGRLYAVPTYDRCWLWSLNWESVWLDSNTSTSLLGGLVLTLDTGFLGNRHLEVGYTILR